MASRPGAWTHFFENFGVAGTPSPGMRFEQFSNVAQACAAGLGVALMPLFLIDAELRAGDLVQALPVQVRSPSSYYAVCPITKVEFRPVALFRSWLLDEVARWRDEPFMA
jgi:DNA-binding transcriptional LysR family regulator